MIALSERVAALLMRTWIRRGPPAPATDGNVLVPMTEWESMSGGWKIYRWLKLGVLLDAGLARLSRRRARA